MEQSIIQNTFTKKIMSCFKSRKGIVRAIVVCVFVVLFIITAILSTGPNRISVRFYTFICFCIWFGNAWSIVFEMLELSFIKPYMLYIFFYDVVGYSFAIFFVFGTAVYSTVYAFQVIGKKTSVVTVMVPLVMWGSLFLLIGVHVYFSRLLIRRFKSGTTPTAANTDATAASTDATVDSTNDTVALV